MREIKKTSLEGESPTLTLWCHVVAKGLTNLHKTYIQKVLFILSMHELLLPPGMRLELSMKKAFVNF